MYIFGLGNGVKYIDDTAGINFTTAKGNITPIKISDTVVAFKNPITPQKNFDVSNILDANGDTYGVDADAVILALSSLVFNAGNGGGGAITGETVGSLKAFLTINIPSNFLWCNGESIAVATYPDLFAKIGYTFGGTGATFNLPDFRDRLLKGDNGTNIGTTTGVNTLTVNQLPLTNASGTISVSQNNAQIPAENGAYFANVNDGSTGYNGYIANGNQGTTVNIAGVNVNFGSGQPHEHPNIAVRWAICFESVGN